MRVLSSKPVRIVVILLVVFGGLFVLADRVAVGMAEDEVATRAREEFGLSEEPDVSIGGFPFLTQVLGRSFDEVTLGLDGYRAQVDGQQVTVEDLRIEVRDTELGDGYSSATAATAEGSGTVSYEELTRAYGELLETSGEAFGVAFGYAGEGRLLLSLQARVLGQSVEIGEISGEVVLDGDTVRLEVPDDQIPDAGGEEIEGEIRAQLSMERAVSDLPEGLSLSAVEPAEDGLRLSVTGSDLSIA